MSTESSNWINEETSTTVKKHADNLLKKVKAERKGKYKLVQVDAKTWKEVPI